MCASDFVFGVEMFAALGSVASEVVARNRLDDSILVIEGSKSNELEGVVR